ncbi:hypothetical protein FZC66_07305 [Priestia megaterium]|nr:hypothetical protein FZC66_07305 [Priestia megaterium]
MKEQLTAFFDHAKQSVQQTTDVINKKVTALFSPNGMSVLELYELIKGHPDTIVKKQTLLELTYCFYKLELDGISYYMETKNDYLLHMSIYSQSHTYFTYHSYKDSMKDMTSVNLPTLQ